MTLESAYAAFQDSLTGSLEVGKAADFIIVSDNPLTMPASDLAQIRVVATFVAGRRL